MKDKEHLTIFAGATGVGKTEIGIAFSLSENAEIISADSMQIYKRLEIGTAKPTDLERKQVRHHLIDCWEPEKPFNLSDYINLADRAICDIRTHGKNILVVGGTGLYIEGLVKGIFMENSKDTQIREELNERLAKEGAKKLHNELTIIDEEIAKKISDADGIRIMRALEVFFVTGKTMSAWQKESRLKGDRYSYSLFILDRDRDDLYERINRRVDIMFSGGFVEEVKRLFLSGLDERHQCMKAVGYREILHALKSDEDLSTVKDKVKQATRNYAKRQLTWFRNRLPGITVNLSGKSPEIILDEIKKYLEIKN